MKKEVLYIGIAIAMFFIASPAFAQSIDPQYIFVRKDPMTCSPGDCSLLWTMDDPSNINEKAVNDIIEKIGTGNSSNTRKVGIGVFLNYWLGDFDRHIQSLNALLRLSQQKNIPVFINFEGQVWWDKRPDLWNFWDQNDPIIGWGYNPNNINNVEWTCWEPSCAVQKAWRDWGSEFVVRPPPNLSSPAYIKATQESLKRLIPIVVDWYNKLPANQKFLLGGVSINAEVDIGANYYYYPNGVSNGKGLPGSVQLGYNAVKTAGIKSSGTITTNDINQVVRTFQTTLNKTVLDLGIPRNKIFNHNGGKGAAPFMVYPAGVAYESLEGSLNNYAQPGWSFYGDVTANLANPQSYPDLTNTLGKIGTSEWASPEWLSWASDYNGWVTALRNSLNYHNNRFINIANWEGIRNKQYALDAVKTVVSENPACWVTSPIVQVTTSGNTATVSWEKGAHNDANYFQFSSSAEYNEDGAFKNILGQENVSTKNNNTLTPLGSGTYYWLLTADGCTSQRRIVYGSFKIGESAGTTTHKASLDGDLNGDGHVNDSDYSLVSSGYGSKYTMYDYNNVVKNFGK